MNDSNFRVLLVYANSPMDNLLPVGLSSLAGALRQEGIDYKIFDTTYHKKPNQSIVTGGGERKGSLQVKDVDYSSVGVTMKKTNVFDDFVQEVEDYKPDLIALSAVEPTYEYGMTLLEKINHLSIPTVVGGVFATFSPDLVISNKNVDMICVGEGEEALAELCKRLSNKEDYRNIPNLMVKDGSKIIRNKYNIIENLDELPYLDFSKYEDMRFYRPMSGKLYRMTPVEFSRGCIYGCTYCSAPAYKKLFESSGKWLRYKSIGRTIDEIKHYRDTYNAEYYYFVSETFLAMSLDDFKEFCKLYSEVKLPFWFNTRPETITEDKIKMLEDIGCHRVNVGIESGNQEFRKNVLNRNITNEKIISACSIISNSSIEMSVNNIIGFPDETREMIFDTINLNRKIDADGYSCSIFEPYRGTDLYNVCVNKNYINADTISPDLTSESILDQDCITKEEIKGIFRAFPLYVKLPREKYPLIERTEKFDSEADKIHDELSELYHKVTI